MDWTIFVLETLFGILDLLFRLAVVIFPLFIIIEVLDTLGILKKISYLFQGVLKYLKLPSNAALPIIISQTVGLTYGAGLIIQSTGESDFDSGELMTLCVLFACTHAVFEDTLLFVAIGGQGGIIILTRLILSILVTLFFVYIIRPQVDETVKEKVEG